MLKTEHSVCLPLSSPSALLRLLQRQARVLVDGFGLHPSLSPLLRELWLAHVARTRLLEPAFIRSVSRVDGWLGC